MPTQYEYDLLKQKYDTLEDTLKTDYYHQIEMFRKEKNAELEDNTRKYESIIKDKQETINSLRRTKDWFESNNKLLKDNLHSFLKFSGYAYALDELQIKKLELGNEKVEDIILNTTPTEKEVKASVICDSINRYKRQMYSYYSTEYDRRPYYEMKIKDLNAEFSKFKKRAYIIGSIGATMILSLTAFILACL